MRTPEEIAEEMFTHFEAVGAGKGTVTSLIACAIRAERTKFAAFMDEKGEPRKVLGTLPVTADGAIIGDWASPFVLMMSNEIERGITRTVTYAWTPTTPGRKENKAYAADTCYSTRERAESAQAATARRGEG